MAAMRVLLAFALAGCWTSSKPVDPPKGEAAPIAVAIASVRLADDCPGSIAQAELATSTTAGSCAGDCSSARRACEQSLLQVSLRSTAGMKTAIAVTKIEMLDAAGVAIGTLTVREAQRWSSDGSYTAWDQVVGPGEVLAASYALTAPDWGLVPGGRDPAKKIRVRVTFKLGDGEKTFEKEAVVAAFFDPNVVT